MFEDLSNLPTHKKNFKKKVKICLNVEIFNSTIKYFILQVNYLKNALV